MFIFGGMYYCPKCKRNFIASLSETTLYKYNNKLLPLIHCDGCESRLLIESFKSDWNNGLNLNSSDVQARKISELIIDRITNKNYTDKTPEEILESELLDYLYDIFGEKYIAKYEYEAKVIIQKCISYTFNVPAYKLDTYVVTDEVEKEMIYEGIIGL